MAAADLAKKMEKLTLTGRGPTSSSSAASSTRTRPDSFRHRRKLSLAQVPDVDDSKIDGVRQGRNMSVTEDMQERAVEVSAKAPYLSSAHSSHVGFIPFNRAKVNQDRALTIKNFNDDENQALFAVFDGHGLAGDTVAQWLVDNFEKALLGVSRGLFHGDPEKYFLDASRRLNTDLKNDKRVNSTFSGSTCITCFLHGKTLYTANIGDSRAVLGRRKNGAVVAVDLSEDHKPDLPHEMRRILRHRGRVQPCTGPNNTCLGPARVWLARQDIPGLAMSRSFGDEVAQTVGVISDPDVKKVTLKDRDQFLVLGSDGIFEFMSNQDVVDLVSQYDDPQKASAALAAEAKARWRKEEDVVDDITAIVIYLK